ncbi:pancreatic lipase-related protein 3 isoform X1 [Lepeophtheirus salmonis]|uniref:pancreatic lipase-related protein 3 isoform X1 n=2 Tax=Lepeophtheirus salmonis TaxID=72036 RepID=UPI001AE40CAE|nr:pancreatic lipase-related protein 3-like [Lepeophtheirus salmonis]
MIPIIRLVWIFGVIILIAESKDIKDFNSIISNRGSQLNNLQSRLLGPKECSHELGMVVPMKAVGKRVCPQSKETVNLHMWLYTRNNPEEPQIFKYNEADKLKDSNFNASKLTRMVVHGWGGDCNLAWIVQMRRDLLNESDVNLFCADWRNGTIYPDYGQGAANTQIAGKMIAIFFNNVSQIFGPIGPKLHLIGFSFGAQVCSFAGSNIPNCNRITGLDPAGPSFREHNTSFRLDKSDADFVDVIHTNGVYFTKGGIGLLDVSGHVDFYPFGGETQPYCNNLFEEFLSGQEFGCSHYRAVYLFLESIKNDKCKMVGFPCSGGWNGFHSGEQGCFNESMAFPLGLNTPRNATGKLYLTTRITEPFCGNQVKVEISLEFSPSWSSKLYTRILEIIFQTTGGEKRESFSVASGFSTSDTFGRVMTVDASIPFENIYLKYSIGSINSFFGRVEELTILNLTIIDVKGRATLWKLENKSGKIQSGTEEKLVKNQN